MANENSNVVVDRAQSHWSDLWKKEDYWAIWLGFALLIAAICIFINGAPASYKETIDKSNAIMKVEAEKAPFKTIAYIQAQDAKKGVGFDAYDETYGDMIKKGIVDPTKVTRSALQNAASIAAMVLTTESLVCDIPTPPAAPAPGGDMGGMGGMY